MLLDELVVVLEDVARLGAVPHEDGGRLKPLLEVVQRHGDVLGVVLVEDPNLARGGRFGDAVAVVVEQDSLILGVATEGDAELLGLLDGRVEVLLVAGPEGKGLVLRLQGPANVLEGLSDGRDGRVLPCLEFGAWGCA